MREVIVKNIDRSKIRRADGVQFNLKCEYREYELNFRNMKNIQIIGDSSTGKSLMCYDIREEQLLHTDLYSDILVIDYTNIKIAMDAYGTTDKIQRFRLVIVDNADFVMNGTIENLIWNSEKTRWVIIGRGYYTFIQAGTGRCMLKRNGNKFYTESRYCYGDDSN